MSYETSMIIKSLLLAALSFGAGLMMFSALASQRNLVAQAFGVVLGLTGVGLSVVLIYLVIRCGASCV